MFAMGNAAEFGYKSSFGDCSMASPVLSTACPTFDGASECSMLSDSEEFFGDVLQESSPWQSVSGRLADVLRRQLQEDSPEIESVSMRLASVFRRHSQEDADDERPELVSAWHASSRMEDSGPLHMGDGEHEDCNHDESTRRQSVSSRLSGVFKRLVEEEQISRQSVSSRLSGVFKRLVDEDQISTENWQNVGCRLAAVFQEAAGEEDA